MRKRCPGFTLLELLFCLAIVAWLLLRFSAPSFARKREELEVDGLMTDLRQAVAMARSAAVAGNTIVTFCRSNDGLACKGGWNAGSIIFTDPDADHVLDGDETLLFRLPPVAAEGSLSFNAFGNRQYLQLTPLGVTRFQNGNFTWCPDNGDLHLARQMIISFSGKTRMAVDGDGDGIVENSQGKPLTCP